MIARLLSQLAGASARRARLVLVLAVALGLLGAGLALRLHPSAATSTFVSASNGQYRATQSYYARFGEEPVDVLVKGNLQQLVLSSDIHRLLELEECLSGHMSASAIAGAGGARGPCGRLAGERTVKVVLGPGTFLNQAARQIDEQLAAESRHAQAQAQQSESVIYHAALARGYSPEAARALGRQAARIIVGRFQESVVKVALAYGLTAQPSIDNAGFVDSVVFDSSKPAGTPKQRFAYLFPSREAALVSVRTRSGLSEAQRARTIGLIRQAVAMPRWHLAHGESYVVTGVPVIVSDLAGSITNSIELLMVAVALVMAATLGLIFRGRPRLLPLALALLATALTFGALSLGGGSVTVASVAVLPVLVGLAVDYAIQFQSRVAEARSERDGSGADGEARGADAAPIVTAAAVGGPTLLAAGAASAGAMLALLLSPVPMVRGFGALLIVGMAVAFACTLTVGAAALGLPRRRIVRAPARGVAATVAAAWRGAGELLLDNPLTRLIRRLALSTAVRRPRRLLGVGLALAALGWGLDTQTRVETDITKLVPQTLGSLQGLDELERTSGVGGEIDLMITGKDVTSPATIEWMSSYEHAVLARYGYSSSRGCGQARLCPAFSLPDLFGGPGGAGATKISQPEVAALLAAIPPYFSQDVITPDRHAATLAFGIRAMSLQAQQSLIEGMRSRLHPPAGVGAQLVGLPVLAASSGAQVADPWRRLETLFAGLLAVAIVLLVAFRGDRRRALVPLVPIVLATGWSALILFAVRVPLNPMSVTLGALVIAISTEFSVLLSERHRQERLAGLDTFAALRRSYRRTGAAVAASGVTATAGFGVLAVSNIRMLRDFGVVTMIDLGVSLIGVLVALPAVLVLSERRRGAEQPTPADGRRDEGTGRGVPAGLRAAVQALGTRARRVGRPRRSARAGSGHGHA
jgi:hydrophobe/amphiphile efflux-3 (HAE3) family protein